ncbi:hypothetical protein KRX51_02110 [Corynebacterium sp. TAE3-ERU12]|uniref:hypothetical protein n=1 Tax=Corynebacterium sp. TAE3-ERU12 TaxID=2849491 RepID=UPI001C46CE10|nr:hypothetical protein [Corynebacterium sp. TAE3-ERU12]MBV7294713.1 hypothetical protein [Corynebacterium sp. TAE3-ERU12]
MGTLIRLHLRTRWIFITAWLVPLFALVVVAVPGYYSVYPNDAAFEAMLPTLVTNAGMKAVYGPIDYDFSLPAVAIWENHSYVLILGSVMMVLLAASMTRVQEENGITELVRAQGLTARVPTLAAAAVIVLIGVVFAAASAAGLYYGHTVTDEVTVSGSILGGLAAGTCMTAMGAVGVVLAQLAGTGRAARGYGLAAVAVAFVLRAVADVNDIGWLRWLSPLGWRDIVAPFTADEAWWPLLYVTAFIILAFHLALGMATSREVGATWPATSARAGTKHSAPGTVDAGAAALVPGYGHWGLRWRLDRMTAVWWGVAVVATAVGFASLTADMVELLKSSPGAADFVPGMLDGDAIEAAFLAHMGVFAGTLLCCAAVHLATSAAGDERHGWLIPEHTSGTTHRTPYVVAWVFTVLTVVAISAIAAPLTMWAAQSSTDKDLTEPGLWLLASFAPGAIATAGLATLLAAAAPRWSGLAWIPVAFSGVVSYLYELLNLPEWMQDWSLVGHPVFVESEGYDWVATAVLVAIGIAGAVIGAVLADRRNSVG